MNLLLAGGGEVLVVAGQENNLSHRQRVEAFAMKPRRTFRIEAAAARDLRGRSAAGA